MSLRCDNLSTLLPFSSLHTRYTPGHVIVLGLLPIICIMVPVPLYLCLPCFIVTETHLSPVSTDDHIYYLGEGLDHPYIIYACFITSLVDKVFLVFLDIQVLIHKQV